LIISRYDCPKNFFWIQAAPFIGKGTVPRFTMAMICIKMATVYVLHHTEQYIYFQTMVIFMEREDKDVLRTTPYRAMYLLSNKMVILRKEKTKTFINCIYLFIQFEYSTYVWYWTQPIYCVVNSTYIPGAPQHMRTWRLVLTMLWDLLVNM